MNNHNCQADEVDLMRALKGNKTIHYDYWKKKNKYNAKSTEYGGEVYHSKAEAGYAAELDLRMHDTNPNERVKSWERQVRIPLKAYGVTIRNYYIDFVVYYESGLKEYVEVKGFYAAGGDFQNKWKHFKAQMAVEEPEAKTTIVPV